jgi:osmotically-inducible protein OsmY
MSALYRPRMARTALTEELERRLHEEAELEIVVEEDEGHLVLTGIIVSEIERDTALDIIRESAGTMPVDDNLELDGSILDTGYVDPGTEGATTPGGQSLEPGDFSAQPLIVSPDAAAGPTSSLDEDVTEDATYVPPTDPVGTDTEVIGGLELSSMDSVEVERSALDGAIGDEAIRDAVLRELREDAATTDLEIEVEVFEGDVTLRGTVAFLEDTDSALEVAARVPGVVSVTDELVVAGL